MSREWTDMELTKLKTLWTCHGLSEISDQLDRSERSVALMACELGLTSEEYATAVARNDADTVHYCRLLIRDGEFNSRRIAEKLHMPIRDVNAVRKHMMRNHFAGHPRNVMRAANAR